MEQAFEAPEESCPPRSGLFAIVMDHQASRRQPVGSPGKPGFCCCALQAAAGQDQGDVVEAKARAMIIGSLLGRDGNR